MKKLLFLLLLLLASKLVASQSIFDSLEHEEAVEIDNSLSNTPSTTEETTTTLESTTVRWIPPAKSVEPWMEGKEDLVAQCFRLGVIGVRENSNTSIEIIGVRSKRHSMRTKPIVNPYAHPRRPLPSRLACIENFQELVRNTCHSVMPRRPPRLNCTETTMTPLLGRKGGFFGNFSNLFNVTVSQEDFPDSQGNFVPKEDDLPLELPRWSVAEMIENCCSSTENQCVCFFGFGQKDTPLEGVCTALLMEESGRTPPSIAWTLKPSTTETQSSTTENIQHPTVSNLERQTTFQTLLILMMFLVMLVL